jgi:hypothetical protein
MANDSIDDKPMQAARPPYARWRRFAPMVAIALVATWLFADFGDDLTRHHDGLTYAGAALSRDLDQQSSAGERASDLTRILVDVHTEDGTLCRGFIRAELSGVACREPEGWHLRVQRDGVDFDNPAQVAVLERAVRAAAQGLSAGDAGRADEVNAQ